MRNTQVDLIRHGEPVGGRKYRGNGADDPLSPAGWIQMRDAVGAFSHWDQVISSPMTRCRCFASELAGRLRLPLAIEPGLIEIGMGSWEGRTHRDVIDSDPDDYRAFQRDPVGHRPPGGERLEDFIQRIGATYDRQLMAYPGRRLLLVCHAGVTRAVIGHLLRARADRWYRLRIDYAGLTRINHGLEGPTIEYINRRRLE